MSKNIYGFDENFNKKDSLDNYSTKEIMIGKWINDKPLYRKVIQTTAPTVSADGTFETKEVDIANNIDVGFMEFGFIIDNSKQRQTFPYITNSGNIIKAFITNTKQLHISHNIAQYSGYEIVASILYTKTTD